MRSASTGLRPTTPGNRSREIAHELAELRPVRGRNAEHLADHRDGQRERALLHRVAAALLLVVVEQRRCRSLDGLAQGIHAAAREALHHELAQPRVFRSVHVENRLLAARERRVLAPLRSGARRRGTSRARGPSQGIVHTGEAPV
jgi:hypothetical protein